MPASRCVACTSSTPRYTLGGGSVLGQGWSWAWFGSCRGKQPSGAGPAIPRTIGLGTGQALTCAHARARCAFLQGVLEHITVNNFPIGRNVDEALRTLQARPAPAAMPVLRMTAAHSLLVLPHALSAWRAGLGALPVYAQCLRTRMALADVLVLRRMPPRS